MDSRNNLKKVLGLVDRFDIYHISNVYLGFEQPEVWLHEEKAFVRSFPGKQINEEFAGDFRVWSTVIDDVKFVYSQRVDKRVFGHRRTFVMQPQSCEVAS